MKRESQNQPQMSHHITNDLLSGVFLCVDGSVQLTEDKETELLVLQQASHLLHVEPADSLPIQDTLHHFLQELLVLAETSTVSVFSLNYWTLLTHVNMAPRYLVLLTLPWGDGDSLFTVGLCLITEDFWSTSARGARAPVRGNLLTTFLNTTQDHTNKLRGSEEHSMVINCTRSSTFSPGRLNLICNYK